MTIAEATVVRFTVLADATERLDRFLADQLSLAYSRPPAWWRPAACACRAWWSARPGFSSIVRK
jgi:hypothetical protein